MKKKKQLVRARERGRLMDEKTPFAIKEAFNRLRTNIMYYPNDEEGCPVYGITSVEMSVGKSTISANLAVSFAQLGQKVLLVDADMRRPMLHKIFQIEDKDEKKGFSELLSGIISDDVSVMYTLKDNVSFISSGAIPSNPSALMLGKRIGELIEKWKHEFDIIFIDLPPMGVVTDPLTISDKINGYIMVASVDKSDAKHVNEAADKINQIGSKVVGLVVNGVNPRGEDYKYRYKYRYRYRYRYKEDYATYKKDYTS